MNFILKNLLCAFIGGMLAHIGVSYDQWEFYAILVPAALVQFDYEQLGG